MGEAGLALWLVLRPDIVPHADPDHRRLVILMDDDRQAIVERKRLMRDGYFADQRRNRDRLVRGRSDRLDGRRRRDRRVDRRCSGAGGQQRSAGEQDGEAAVDETHEKTPR